MRIPVNSQRGFKETFCAFPFGMCNRCLLAQIIVTSSSIIIIIFIIIVIIILAVDLDQLVASKTLRAEYGTKFRKLD